MKDFKCPQHDREPLYDYFRRFVQKKAQIPNFPEKDAIEKYIEGLLPVQLASHLTREPPRTLEELYTEAEKYAKLEMAADRVRCGYPRVSVFRVSGLVLVFRPRFSGSGLGLVSGSVSGFGFHPWISNGYPK